MTDTTIKGFKELQDFLSALPAKIEGNIMRAALRAGAKVIADDAKANAPVAAPGSKNKKIFGGYAGALRDSIRVSARMRGGTVTASVKAGGTAKSGATTYYARMVEYGTAPHLIAVSPDERPINYKKSMKKGTIVKVSMRTINRNVLRIGNTFVGPTVMHPGSAARPFLRPALDNNISAVLNAVGEAIKKRLTKQGIDASDVDIEVEE